MFLVVPYRIHVMITSQMFSVCVQQLRCKKFEPHPAMFSRCFWQFPGSLAPSEIRVVRGASDRGWWKSENKSRELIFPQSQGKFYALRETHLRETRFREPAYGPNKACVLTMGNVPSLVFNACFATESDFGLPYLPLFLCSSSGVPCKLIDNGGKHVQATVLSAGFAKPLGRPLFAFAVSHASPSTMFLFPTEGMQLVSLVACN
jgi:hypothetical protein